MDQEPSHKQNLHIKSYIRILTPPLSLLLLIDLLVYGWFIPVLGFYWDDIDFAWFYDLYGVSGLAAYFNGWRPVLGWLYQLNFLLLGDTPWHWQVFSLLSRWICAAGLYFLGRQLWRSGREPAFLLAVFFLVFPGFSQQAIAIVYGHLFIVMACFFFSLGLSLHAAELGSRRTLWILLALLLSAFNLLATEYFFMLELVRPAFFWYRLSGQGMKPVARLKAVLKHWLPYLTVFLAAGVWRVFFFAAHAGPYRLDAIKQIRTAPLTGLTSLLANILKDIWLSAAGYWERVFTSSGIAGTGRAFSLPFILISIAVAGLLALALLPKRTAFASDDQAAARKTKSLLWAGLLALLLGGIPYWLTGLQLSLGFPTDRFSLSFVLGSGLIFTGLVFLVLRKPLLRRVTMVLLITLAAGFQVRILTVYRQDWQALQGFYRQLVWRVPALAPGMVIYSQELPLLYYSDLSLTGPLNLIYDRNGETGIVPYAYYYPTIRNDEGFSPDAEIVHDYAVGIFHGNTSRSLTILYDPPACLHVIDPNMEALDPLLPHYIQETGSLSDTSLILDIPDTPSVKWFFVDTGSEDWCFYYEKADLARQTGDWQTAAKMADVALSLDKGSNDPFEMYPFIEAYAHTGRWLDAKYLTDGLVEKDPDQRSQLCHLWLRIAAETSDDIAKASALSNEYALLGCEVAN